MASTTDILNRLGQLEAELKALHTEGDLTTGLAAERADRLLADLDACEGELKAARLADTQARIERLIRENPVPQVPLAAPIVDKPKASGAPEFKAFLMGTFGTAETKTLTFGTDATGGALVATAQFLNELFSIAARESIARRICRVVTVNGARALDVPVITADRADAVWVAENAAATHAGATFARRTIPLHTARAVTGVSRQLLGIDPEAVVANQLALSVGYLTDQFVMSGTGTGQPLGVTPENAAGVPAGQTVAALSNAALNHDNLMDVFHRLRPPYQNRATWLVSNDVLRFIRRLKDTTGQPLLDRGVTEAGLPTIVNRPVIVSEFLPAIGPNNTTVMVGDFSQYVIAQMNELDLLVDPFSRAANGEVHYWAFQMLGGAPIVGEAFARLRHPA